jgi:hypothetical protein
MFRRLDREELEIQGALPRVSREESVVSGDHLKYSAQYTAYSLRLTVHALRLQKCPNATNGLVNTVFIFHKCKSYEALAILTKPNSRGDSYFGVFQKLFRKL